LSHNFDVYVNDAFGVNHRNHASVVSIVKCFKHSCVGLLVEKEIKMLSPLIKKPKRPFYIIIGGAKVEGKIDVINNLGKSADKILIGGKMALAFVCPNYVSKEELKKAKQIIKKFDGKIVLPTDFVLENKMEVNSTVICYDQKVYDIGKNSVNNFKQILNNAKTIVWNGPLGFFEKKPFDKSTNEITKYLSKHKAKTIIGGGDTAKAIRKTKLQNKMTHVSTGGGATLEFLKGKELIGLKVFGYKL
jgi:phosphoglycerate kinase